MSKETAPNMKVLSQWYNVSYWTMRRWMREIKDVVGPMRGSAYNPKQLNKIEEELGPPPKKPKP